MVHYDYFVIGGGSGGVRSARIAAQHGAKVGLAEKGALGGTCVNVGCVPKKLFSYAADYGQHIEDMKGFGWENVQADFNWQKLIKNKNNEIERLNNIYNSLLVNAGVTIHHGTAKFMDQHTIDVDGDIITADKILIAVGGKPRAPHFPGAEYAIVSDDAFYLKEFPRRVVIQGGGYVAVEFAHILHGLGAKVSILYRNELWLSGFDKEISLHLKDEYLKQGIDLNFNSDIKYVTKEDGCYQVFTTDDRQIDCDLVLSAIGRVPETGQLSLDAAKIATMPNGQIKVNDSWQTSIPSIYAIGDVSNSWNLTPYAIAEGHILSDRLFGSDTIRKANLDLVPTAVFSSPPIGTIGITEEYAKKNGMKYEVFKTSFKPLKHTLSGNETRTFIKMIVEKPSNKVIGFHMIGDDSPEILQGIAVAMNMGATKEDFDTTIGIHPTSAEEIVTLK